MGKILDDAHMAHKVSLQHFHKIHLLQFSKWFVNQYACIVYQYINTVVKITADELLQTHIIIISNIKCEGKYFSVRVQAVRYFKQSFKFILGAGKRYNFVFAR